MTKAYGRVKRYIWVVSFVLLMLLANIIGMSELKHNTTIAEKDILVFAIHPYLPYNILKRNFLPLKKYLEDKINKKIIIKVGASYIEHIKAVGLDSVDFAFIGPAEYTIVVDNFGSKPIIACIMTNGAPYFTGNIIVRADSTIRTLENLKGKSFAFVDPHSTMGYYMPLWVFYNAGFANEILKNCRFLKSHENVALGVLSGDWAAGAVKNEVFEKYKHLGLKSIVEFPRLREHLIIARSDIQESMFRKLQDAFLSLNSSNEKAKNILKSVKPGLTGFCKAKDSDYNGIRNVLSKLKKAGLLK